MESRPISEETSQGADAQQAEAPQTEAPQEEAPHADAQQAEASQADEPQAETPQVAGSTSGETPTDDALQNFFRNLPTPEQYEKMSGPEEVGPTLNACGRFIEEALRLGSADVDFGFLLPRINTVKTEFPCAQYLYMVLATLAFEKGVPDDDQTRKARLLRYCA
jgi:hypothetical protein